MRPFHFLIEVFFILIMLEVGVDSLFTVTGDHVQGIHRKNSTFFVDDVVERFENIKKSVSDRRSYRGLKLRNDLHVLLISDSVTDKGAACMTVSVGSMHDFDELPGLAHFLEHMLFMGSKKYPPENYFSKFVQEHAGTYNGQTEDGMQNYYFDISHDDLAEALDIFAQFFLNPLMDSSTAAREVHAVDSEHAMYRTRDDWRFPHLLNSLSKPGHPHSRFPCGNLKSLHTDPKLRGINVREKLLELYSTWYSSNIMYLAVLGKESLDDLEEMVVPLFKNIENKNVQKKTYSEHPWGPEQLKKKIYGVPIADIRYLLFRFPLPGVVNHYRSVPLEYISELLGHEGPGSLLAELKERNWAESLTADYEDIPGFTFLDLQIDLTEDAMDHTDEVVKLVFQYIHLLQTNGVQEWFFRELQKTGETLFRFKDKESPFDYVASVSASMVDHPMEDVLTLGYIRNEWKPELIKEFLNYLTPANTSILIVSKSFEKFADLQSEPWYDTQYAVRKIPDHLIEKIWNITAPLDTFRLPPPNRFIADNFDLYRSDEDKSKYPRLIHQSSIAQIWFQQDEKFKIPKSHIKLNLFSPVTCTNRKNILLTGIFSELFNTAFQTHAYAATRAGLEWKIEAMRCGIHVRLSGYSEKVPMLLEEILSAMLKFELKEEKFEIEKEARIRDLRNFATKQPYFQAHFYLFYLLDNVTASPDELLAVAQLLQMDDMKIFLEELFSRVFVQGLIYGNCHRKQAENIIKIIQSSFESRSVSAVLSNEIVPPPIIKMDDKSEYFYKVLHEHHDSSCYTAYFQLGSAHPVLNTVLADLFFEIVGEKCFQVLRTETQLGYAVECKGTLKNGVLGFLVTVQSDKHPEYVNSRVEMFLRDLRKTLHDMTETEFETHKMSLRYIYMENVVGQIEQLLTYWDEITDRRYHFGNQAVKTEQLASVKKSDVLNFYEQYIHESSGKRRKLSIHVVSNITNPTIPDVGPIKSIEIKEAADFRNASNFYPQAHSYMEVPPVGN